MSNNYKEAVPRYYIGLSRDELKALMKFISIGELHMTEEEINIVNGIYADIDEDFSEVMKD